MENSKTFITDMAMKMKNILLLIIALLAGFPAFTQQKADSAASIPLDVIIRINGNLFQCKVVEVNDSMIVFQHVQGDTSHIPAEIPRTEVYAIAYSYGFTQVITPQLMGKEASIYPEKKNGWEIFKGNLGKGAINVGVGFIEIYSPIKNADSFEDEKVLPSVFAGYTFEIKKKLKGGVHLGIAGNQLSKSAVSEYDQLKVSTEIDEKFICLGLYGRYDILDGMFKPFVKAGIDFIGVIMTTTSMAEALNGSNQSLKSVVDQSGLKLYPILRGGMEVYFGNRFGIYGDVGTGLSLVQVGVVFSLK